MMLALARAGRSPGLRHGFFTRQGGVSEGVWASLNVGLRSGDDAGTDRRQPRAAPPSPDGGAATGW